MPFKFLGFMIWRKASIVLSCKEVRQASMVTVLNLHQGGISLHHKAQKPKTLVNLWGVNIALFPCLNTKESFLHMAA